MFGVTALSVTHGSTAVVEELMPFMQLNSHLSTIPADKAILNH